MKLSVVTTLSALAATSFAQLYQNQSAPFSLIVVSTNATINGTTLGACHEGAAIEGLCVAGRDTTSNYTAFTFNTTDASPPPQTSGYLTWLLIGGNFEVSSALTLSANPSTNVGVPLFFPGDLNAQNVAFDERGYMNIIGYQDDTVVPPNSTTTAYFRWYVCYTNFGYYYQTLAWVYGVAEPQNPTCQKVDVYRQFR